MSEQAVLNLPNRFLRMDSTILKSFAQECQRKTFYEHGLGWRSLRESHALVYGRAIHAGMEVFNRHGYTKEFAKLAFEKFCEIYDEAVPPEVDMLNAPKDKAGARFMFDLMISKFNHKEMRTATLDGEPLIEVTNEFPIKLGSDVVLTFVYKLDVVRVSEEKVYVVDYKTTRYLDKWLHQKYAMDFQMNNYNLMLLDLFSAELVGGVIIYVMIFRKGLKDGTRANDIERVESSIAPHMVNARMDKLMTWMVKLYEEAHAAVDQYKAGRELTAFPQNSNACFNWGQRCAFYDLCYNQDGVFKNMHLMPADMEVRFWCPGANDKE